MPNIFFCGRAVKQIGKLDRCYFFQAALTTPRRSGLVTPAPPPVGNICSKEMFKLEEMPKEDTSTCNEDSVRSKRLFSPALLFLLPCTSHSSLQESRLADLSRARYLPPWMPHPAMFALQRSILPPPVSYTHLTLPTILLV